MTAAVPTLTAEELSQVAEAFKLLGDPSRLRIVIHCLDGPKTVGNISETLGLSQTLVSHHLRLLRSARLLRAERKARNVFYELADNHVSHMITDIAEHVLEERQ